MENKYDIFITFSEEIAKSDAQLYEIIEKTIESLKLALKRILKRDIRIAVKGKDFNAGNALKHLDKSILSLIFLHPIFEPDTEYQNELSAVCKRYGLAENQNLKSVFKLSLAPLKNPVNPFCLEELISYDFFEKNRFNRRIKSLSYSDTDAASTLYGKLLDLAYDISAALEDENKDAQQAEDKYIYLGLTTFDQQHARDEMRRELSHYGYKVLPATNMPMTGEEFERSLTEHLSKSSVVIQLMGSQYGDVLKGTKYSMPDFQNKIIREYQLQNSDSLKRFIWIPQNNKISDQRQALYLKRMRRDDADENTEIIESPLETFKTILSSRLEIIDTKEKSELDNISKVFLLTEEEKTPYIEDLYSALSLSGLKVNTLDYEEQTGIYARYLQSLRDADAVIIIQHSENNFWLNSKLRDLIKAPGIGRLSPFRKIIIITGLLPDAQLVNMIKSKVEIIDGPQPKPDAIIQKLISE